MVKLFGVGLAWGAPFVALAFINTSVAEYPHLAAWLAPLRLPLALLCPLCAVAGVILIRRLARCAPRPKTRGVLVFLAAVGWPVIVGAAASILMPAFAFASARVGDAAFVVFFGTQIAVALEATALVILGIATTLVVLWRRRRWLAPIWLAVYGALSGVLYAGSQQTSPAGDDLGGGLLAVGLLIVLVGAVLVSVLIVTLAATPTADQPVQET